MHTDVMGTRTAASYLLESQNILKGMTGTPEKYRVSGSTSPSTVARRSTAAIENLKKDVYEVLQAQQKALTILAQRQGSVFDMLG